MRCKEAKSSQRGGQVSGSGGSPVSDTESEGGASSLRFSRNPLHFIDFFFFSSSFRQATISQSTYSDFAFVCKPLHGTVLFE